LAQQDLRFERKYLISTHTKEMVEQVIKLHPAGFSPIYHPREVNNIYFDTLGLKFFYDNLDGEKDRLKVRIRWYGSLLGLIEKPVLEYKIKNGLLGRKESYRLQPFLLNNTFSKASIFEALQKLMESKQISNELLSLRPTLLNRYQRKYFLSKDKKIRITIDSRLEYYGINYIGNRFINKSLDKQTVILEMKYNPEMDDYVRNISAHLPFQLTKSSKYLQGLERVLL
jgi:SPX domain protein involved in polyphosphate accumulation